MDCGITKLGILENEIWNMEIWKKETGMRHFECVSDAVRPWFSPVRYLHVWNYFGDTIWGGSVGYAPPSLFLSIVSLGLSLSF